MPKDCTKCLFKSTNSYHTHFVFCSLKKSVTSEICKDYTEKKDMPSWSEIVKQNEGEQLAMSFGLPTPVEQLPTKPKQIRAYVKELQEAKKLSKQIDSDYLNYGIIKQE